MISLQEVLKIHEILIEKFGGATGVRDPGGLESALGRPFATFEGKELHPTPTDKAAALIESLVKNHPFHDGNKRIGYTMMRLFLLENKLDLNANHLDKYEFVMGIAQGDLEIDQISEWIRNRVTELD